MLITENELDEEAEKYPEDVDEINSMEENEFLLKREGVKKPLKIGKGIATLRKRFSDIGDLKHKLMDIDLIENLANTHSVQNLDNFELEKVYLEFEKSTKKIPVNIYGLDFGLKFSQRQWKKVLEGKLDEISERKNKIEMRKSKKTGIKEKKKKSLVLYSERKMFMKFNDDNNNGWITYGYKTGNGDRVNNHSMLNDNQKDEKIVFNRVEINCN